MHIRQLRAWLVRLAGLFGREARDRELAEELEAHLQMHVEDNLRAGMSPREARRQALIKLGGVAQTEEEYRRRRGLPLLEDLRQDLRYGARVLARNKGFTAVAVLTLALGIGANTAIFSVVNAVLLRPLPYKDSGRIMRLWRVPSHGGATRLPFSEPEFLEYRGQSRSFEHFAAFATDALNVTGAGEPERVTATWASADFFDVLGVRPLLGRTYSAEEDQLGRHYVVVLSHSLWQRRFGADPALIGRAITLNGRSRTVLGVMPQGFKFPSDDVEMWVPLALEASSTNLGMRYLEVIARLRPGAEPEQARAEVRTVAGRIAGMYPEYYKGGARPEAAIVPLHEQMVGDTRPALLILLGGVAFMLLIACANVANLFLARAAARRKEIATRTAFGATRTRIVRQLLTESLLLFVLGGGLGLLLAQWGVRALVLSSPLNIPRMNEVSIDGWTLAFTASVSLLTGIFFGLAPALQASKTDLNEALKEGGRGGGEGRGQTRTRGLLVVSEVALAVVLLVGAGLMVRSFSRLSEVRLGFVPENVLTMRLSLPASKYPEGRQTAGFYRELLGRLKKLPGVEAAAATSQLPLGEVMANASFEVEGRGLERGDEIADYNIISPEYFRAMNIGLLRGRPFAESDGRQTPAAVIVNQTLARKAWPGEEALGKRLRLTGDSPWLSVVGVVADVKNRGLGAETKPEMYFPHVESQFGMGPIRRDMTLVVRSVSDPKALTGAIRGEVRSLDSDLPVFRVRTMDEIVADSISRTRFTTALLSLFACLALILAGVGVYGVMSYNVARRTHEIGIRKALGARPRDVVLMLVRQGFALALAGVGLGLAGSFALTRVMESLLYGVGANDPATFAAIPAVLLSVSLLASYLPARRAMRIDPTAALRHG